jgi:hypothetical protein
MLSVSEKTLEAWRAKGKGPRWIRFEGEGPVFDRRPEEIDRTAEAPGGGEAPSSFGSSIHPYSHFYINQNHLLELRVGRRVYRDDRAASGPAQAATRTAIKVRLWWLRCFPIEPVYGSV